MQTNVHKRVVVMIMMVMFVLISIANALHYNQPPPSGVSAFEDGKEFEDGRKENDGREFEDDKKGITAHKFAKCLKHCVPRCLLKVERLQCTAKCFGKCIIHPQSSSSSSLRASLSDDCTYHCALDRCTKCGQDLNRTLDCVDMCGTNCGQLAPSPI